MAKTVPKYLTNNQAKDTWCPFTRHPYEAATGLWVSVNKKPDNDNPNFAACLGRKCALWEWMGRNEDGKKVGKCGMRK